MNIKQIEKNVLVEDGHILIDQPLQYEKYGRRIIVKQLNYFYEWGTFAYAIGSLLERYYMVCSAPILPNDTEDVEKFKSS